MEFTLSGNALKTFARSITCISRVGNDFAIEASPSEIKVLMEHDDIHPLSISWKSTHFLHSVRDVKWTFICTLRRLLKNGMPGQADTGEASGEQPERSRTSASEIPSNHTRIWSELSGSAARSGSGSDGRQVPEERILKAGGQSGIERISTIQISKAASAEGNIQTGPDSSSLNLSLSLYGHGFSQRHPSNWVDANDEDDDNEDGAGLCVRSTPPYYEDQ